MSTTTTAPALTEHATLDTTNLRKTPLRYVLVHGDDGPRVDLYDRTDGTLEGPHGRFLASYRLTWLRSAHTIVPVPGAPSLLLEPEDIAALLAWVDATPTTAEPKPSQTFELSPEQMDGMLIEDVRPVARERARAMLALYTGDPVPATLDAVHAERLADLITDLVHLAREVNDRADDGTDVLRSALANVEHENERPRGWYSPLPAATRAAVPTVPKPAPAAPVLDPNSPVVAERLSVTIAHDVRRWSRYTVTNVTAAEREVLERDLSMDAVRLLSALETAERATLDGSEDEDGPDPFDEHNDPSVIDVDDEG
jgi:hypothetical protein